MFWTASGIAQPQCHGHLADGKDGHGIIHPKSVIRPTIGLDYLFLYCLFICFGVLFAVFLPVSSRHSTLCLRQYGRNTTNITSKTFMNSNDRFGIMNIPPHIHEFALVYSRIYGRIFMNIPCTQCAPGGQRHLYAGHYGLQVPLPLRGAAVYSESALGAGR